MYLNVCFHFVIFIVLRAGPHLGRRMDRQMKMRCHTLTGNQGNGGWRLRAWRKTTKADPIKWIPYQFCNLVSTLGITFLDFYS